MGENGAGKSTLGKILAGVDTADAGQIRLDGQLIAPTTPLAARRLGIAMVHQELAFCPNLSVAENLCLGELPTRAGWLDRDVMLRRARTMLASVAADFDVDRPVSELSTAQEQVLQIAGAVGTGARVIVFDEPTSSLSSAESERLFQLIDGLKARGLTLLYVSHRMEEIFRLCDAITVLRDGRHVKTEAASAIDRDQLVRLMVGRPVSALPIRRRNEPLGRELLRVENLSSPGRFSSVSFQVHAGEVVGLAGLVGSGRSEVAQAIMGLDAAATGTVAVLGRSLPLGDMGAALDAGLGLVPEDRKRLGLVLGLNCRENSSLAALDRFSSWGWMLRRAEREMTARYMERLRVKTPSMESEVGHLSGGNQQKVALAKWLARECRVLIVDEPTRGVDVGAKAEIHELLDELAGQGMGVLVISSELPEVMALSRRILVLRAGRLVGGLDCENFSQPALLRMMAGVE